MIMKQDNLALLFVGAISVVSLTLGAVAFQRSNQVSSSILIYDREDTTEQLVPFLERGFEPISIIEQAISEANGRGYFVVDSDLNIRAPDGSKFLITDFVALPEGGSSDE